MINVTDKTPEQMVAEDCDAMRELGGLYANRDMGMKNRIQAYQDALLRLCSGKTSFEIQTLRKYWYEGVRRYRSQSESDELRDQMYNDSLDMALAIKEEERIASGEGARHVIQGEVVNEAEDKDIS